MLYTSFKQTFRLSVMKVVLITSFKKDTSQSTHKIFKTAVAAVSERDWLTMSNKLLGPSRTRRPHVPSSPLTFSGSLTLWVFKILNDRRNFPDHNFTNLSNISLKFTFVWCTCIQESWTKLSLLTSHKFWRYRIFFVNKWRFLWNRRYADHSLVRPLALCRWRRCVFGFDHFGNGGVTACGRAVANFVLAL